MEGGNGHTREGGVRWQKQRPSWPGPVLRLTRASKEQPPQPARYDQRPVQQPCTQEREVREMLNTVITNERLFIYLFLLFPQETSWTAFAFLVILPHRPIV